jgi:hypothetical protein
MSTTVGRKKDDGYRLKKHVKIGSSVPIGDKTIAPGVSHLTVIRPQMQKGPLWFRIAPTLDKDNLQQFMPVCYTDDPALDNVTDWVRAMPAARYMGVEGGERATCLLHAPNNESYDPWKVNPYYLLYRYAKRAHDNVKSKENANWQPQWNGVIHGKEAGLKNPDVLYMLLGYVYENGKDRYFKENGVPLGLGENDGTILIQLTKSGGEAVVTQAVDANPNFQQGVADHDTSDPAAVLAAYNDYFEKAHKYGDVTSLKTGRICCVHDPELFPVDQLVPTKAPKIGISTNKKGGGKKEEFSHYDAFFRKNYFYRRQEKFSVDLSEHEEKIKKRIQFLSELLYVPSHEELALWIAFAFKPVGKLLTLAWADNPEFMTDDVRKVLGAARVVAVSGSKKSRAKADVTAPPQEELAADDEVTGSPVTDDDENEDDLPPLPPDADEIDDEEGDATPPESPETDDEVAEDPATDDVPPEPEAEAPAADEEAAAEDADPEDDETLDDPDAGDDDTALPEGGPDADDDDEESDEVLPPLEDDDDDGEPDAAADESTEEAPLPDDDDAGSDQRPRTAASKPATKPRTAPAAQVETQPEEETGPPVTKARPASPKPAAATRPAVPAAKPAVAQASKPAAAAAPKSYYKGAANGVTPAATPADPATQKRIQAKDSANTSAKARSAARTAK